jgi:hypothetical protein
MTASALRLKEYIDTIDNFDFIESDVCPYRDHIGALFTDSILQAGMNYRSVVMPRVESVLIRFPEADTVSAFSKVIDHYGVREVLRWNNTAKIRRMEDLVSFCSFQSIETANDLTDFLNSEYGEEQLKQINGIGNKTCDYMKRLLGFDTVAVDRHIREFLVNANIDLDDYFEIKEVVEFAADFMQLSRRSLDYSIWSYMTKKEQNSFQLTFDF